MKIPTMKDVSEWFDILLPAYNTLHDSIALLRPTTFENAAPKFTRAEQGKFSKIKILVLDICKKLGIYSNIHVRITEDREPCLGTIHSFGGPLISLQQSYFTQYDKKDLTYQEWLTILDRLPNNSSELRKYLAGCDKTTRANIVKLAQKYRDTLSQDELEFLLARDLYSAKNYTFIHSQALDAIGLFASNCLVNALVEHNKLEWKGKLLANIVSQIACRIIPNYFFANYHTNQASLECATPDKFQKGALQFYKKAFLVENKSADTLDRIAQLQDKTSCASAMSWKMHAVTGLGSIALLANYFFQARKVYNFFKKELPKKLN